MNIKFYYSPVSIFFTICIFTFFSSTSFAQVNSFRPVKTLCGAVDSEGKPFVVIDYEVRQAKGVGSHTDNYAGSYNESTYPVQNYRLVFVSGHRFRIGTQVVEQAYFPGQFLAYLSIYEELNEKLIKRSYFAVPIDTLMSQFQFGYEVANSEVRVSCHVSLINSQAAKAKSDKNKTRKPAKK
mgnify:CR=1 FL=1